MKNEFDCLVIGCGFAGAVIAREHAERGGKKVLIIDKRSHIGGNAYDSYNDDGILIHNYGPHIFHTQSSRVFEYLSRFTEWRDYSHEVLADIHGKLIPVPFNLNSLYLVFEQSKAERLEQKLISVYGTEKRVTISELRGQTDSELLELADFIYKNVFMYYTQKQWGIAPENIDPSVTARVPILISYDNRYFQDKYQGIPSDGYTSLFEKLIDHPNISLQLNTDSASVLKLIGNRIYFCGSPFYGRVIYTGALDELFDCRFGRLPYRTLDFLFETHEKTWYQSKGTVNYTVDQPYTRITEFKHLSGQIIPDKTTIMKEYPREYTGAGNEIPYYAIINLKNEALYEKYKRITEAIDDFYLLGRLAEYKYYNMDVIVERALLLADSII
ncbi:MAG: UDP-galactopyranose mutase [Clostridia bacterium]|jgi:UDP-galactopyranose mutase|nr:UDP-galactopyranose mutase [Clostridia bacterium]